MSRDFRTFDLGRAAPGTGLSGDGTSHLLILQQLDVQVSLGRPCAASDVSQPGGRKIKSRLPVWKSTDHTRAPSDLPQDPLEWIIGPDATPVLLRELIVSERLFDSRCHKLGGFGQAQRAQLVDHSDSLLASRHNVLAGMDRLEHGRDLSHLR